MNPESVFDIVNHANITLTSLRIISNDIRDAFCAILPEKAVHNLGTGYMEEE